MRRDVFPITLLAIIGSPMPLMKTLSLQERRGDHLAPGLPASVPDPAPGQNLYWIWEAANACGGGGSAPFDSCP